ncbi:MAG: PDZ domain-containing protein [Candidatus Omnitrophica bacterium]|nr:PDZ domain-containing protein [Candidatus Omnitrophota bacterium]
MWSFSDKRIRKVLGVCVLIFFLDVIAEAPFTEADTVMLKDESNIKGLIIDEMKDRIVVSTADGERTIMKADIRFAVYDDEERSLLQIGRNQLKKGQYFKAYQTYEKAAELNPDSEEARDKRDHLRAYLETKTRYDIADSVRRNRENFNGETGRNAISEVRKKLGLELVSGKKYVTVEEVTKNRLGASRMPFLAGDRIISIWGEMAVYQSAEEVADMLLRPGETRMVIERDLSAELKTPRGLDRIWPFSSYKNVIGAELKIVRRGLVITEVSPGGAFKLAGAEPDDLVFRIGGRNTRYLPFREVEKMIKDREGKELEVVVQRDIKVWKKD